MSDRFQSKPEKIRLAEGESREDIVLSALRSNITEHHVTKTPGAAKEHIPDFCVIDASSRETLFYIESKSCNTQCCRFTISRERIYNGSDTWRSYQPPYFDTPYYTALYNAYFVSVYCDMCGSIWLLDTEMYLNKYGDPQPNEWKKGKTKNENYWQPYVWFNLNKLENDDVAWRLS